MSLKFLHVHHVVSLALRAAARLSCKTNQNVQKGPGKRRETWQSQPMAGTVNVVQGLSAAGSFVHALHPGRGELLANEDVLSCGPLPPFRSVDEWGRLRKAYWEAVSPDDSQRSFNRDLLANAQALREAQSIVLWVGLGAAEQLLLAWTVRLLKLIGSAAQVHVVQFTHLGEHDGEAWGLGLLNPEQIKRHPPSEQLSAETTIELERFWERVTSADPAGLLSVLSEKSAPLQRCRASVQPLLYRYPDHQTGLGRWESELLRYTKGKGPQVPRVIGHTMAHNFDADLVGDAYLFSRLRRLAGPGLAHPLVTMSGDPLEMRNCEVALTDVGESVLAAKANAVELNGIDDWILGVHLDSKSGPVSYRKDGTLVAR
jgi:hypothetical protein